MKTKLSLFCEKIIEIGIIVSLIMAPLLINRYGENIYDLPKGTIVRSIALVMLIAFIILKTEERSKTDKTKTTVKTNPLFLACILMAISYFVSTIFSVTPHTSWWGHLGSRYQGFYTVLSYITICIITALTLQRREQIERIITVIILTSIAVCTYGIFQAFAAPSIRTVRIDATLGNPIFFGAYLIMVIPLTIARLIKSVKSSDKYKHFFIVAYSLILVLKLICLILTQSRGPMVGLLVGGSFFLVLYFIINNWRKLAFSLYALGLLLLIFLILFNIPGGPLEPLKKVPFLGRFGQIFETEGGAGKVRLLIWEGMINMVKSEPSRAAIGYGPEMMRVLYYKHAPAELVTFEKRVAFPDRAHSDFYDILATNGFIGIIIYLTIILLATFYLLKYLGLMGDRLRIKIFTGLTIACVILGVFLPYIFTNSFIYTGLGIVFGIFSAAFLFILTHLLAKKNDESLNNNKFFTDKLIFIGIGSALIGHFAELGFGINVNPISFYGWLLLGLFINYAFCIKHTESNKENTQNTQSNSIFFCSFAASLVLITLIYNFVTMIHPAYERAPHADIIDSLFLSFTKYTLTTPYIWQLGLFTVLMIGIGVFITVYLRSINPIKSWAWNLNRYFLIVISTGIIFLIIHSFIIYLPGISVKGTTITNLPMVKMRIYSIVHFYVWLFLIMAISSIILYKSDHSDIKPDLYLRWGNSLIYIILIIVGMVLLTKNDINLIKANNLTAIAHKFQRDKMLNTSTEIYKDIKEITPDPTFTYASIAENYRLMAEREKSQKIRLEYINKSLENAKISIEYEPKSWYRNANISRLHRFMLNFITDTAKRQENISQAEKYYKKALDLCPKNPQLYNEIGEFYTLLKDYPKAIKYYQESLQIDKTFAETLAHLGDIYLEKGEKETAAKYYNQAVQEYQHSDLFFIHPNQDILYIRSHQKLISLQPDNYLGYYGLARYQAKKGDKTEALKLAQSALLFAPDKIKPQIQRFIDRHQK